MSAEFSTDFLRARRAYEFGRLRSSTWRALIVSLPIAAVGLATSGSASIAMLLYSFAVWVFAYWRGDVLLRGSLYGLLGGLITTLLPMSVLRPCCAPGAPMTADCCTMPGACLAAGAAVGLVLAAMIPFAKTSWWRMGIGVVLGMTSIAVLKCATLFAGEAVGLLGGLALGVAAASTAKHFLGRRATA